MIYCLPMRTLVDQTVRRVEKWLVNLRMTEDVGVVTLMGGEPRKLKGRSRKPQPASMSMFEWALELEQQRENETVGAGR